MAITTTTPPPPSSSSSNNNNNNTTTTTPPPSSGVDINAWTLSALQSLSVSPIALGTSNPLPIPLDIDHHHHNPRQTVTIASTTTITATKSTTPNNNNNTPPSRPPSRRDSLAKRHSLLKGHPGSRARRRYENAHLLHVPNLQPPLPSDFSPQATHPVHNPLPYSLANSWDGDSVGNERLERAKTERKKIEIREGRASGVGKGEVPRGLREVSKRSGVVKSWVRALEEPVRQFLVGRGVGGGDDVSDEDDEEEEILFTGRNNTGAGWKYAHRKVHEETVDQGMVLDSFGDAENASFKRWLTHAISDYYGLESKSVNLSNPSRRVVYIGLKKIHQKDGLPFKHFPRPLWELC